MSAPDYLDVTANPSVNHNASPQHGVEPSLDPALEISREHHHAHLHHSERALRGREDDVAYTKGTTFEQSNIPDQDPQDHALHRRHHAEETKGHVHVMDEEKGTSSPVEQEVDPRTHTLSRFYGKFRIMIHVFLWLLFTGYVALYLMH